MNKKTPSEKPPRGRGRPQSYLLILVASVLVALQQRAMGAGDQFPESHPIAGVQPKRPVNYLPYKYPYSPQDLLRQYGAAMDKLAKEAWVDIDNVDAHGIYKNTLESLNMHRCPEWFKDAKIGLFLDWGPWSIGGYSRALAGASYPDWYELNMEVFPSVADALRYYLTPDVYTMFNIRQYHTATWGADIGDDDLINFLGESHLDPAKIAKLAKECGFRYVVPFLKHHGGYCLWDSSFTRRNSVAWGPGRDFAKEFDIACRNEGLKYGIYISVCEWDYPALLPDGEIGSFDFRARLKEGAKLSDCFFLSGKTPVANYARDYFVPATKELIDETNPDIIWWDQPSEKVSDSSVYGTRELNAYFYNKALGEQKEVCINDRSGGDYMGEKAIGKADFHTSEYGGAISPLDGAWEECRSFSHNFGYNWTEESSADAILSDKACIDLVVDIVGRGGNLLLIVSPTGAGEIPPRQLHAIENMGDWLKKFGEAIYGTRTYPIKEQPKWGRITHSKDGGTVYLLITEWPADGRIDVPAISIHGIESATVIDGQGTPGFCQPGPAGFTVDLSACTPGDSRVSVVALKTKGP
jgi:alpha-L-fucosidase